MNLDSPIKSIKGIGPKTEQLFQSIGVYTVGDILLYFPRDYQRFPEICSVDQAMPEQKCAIYAQVRKAPAVNMRSSMQTASLDLKGDTKQLRLMWFRSPYIRNLIKAGGFYVFFGKVVEKNGLLYMDQPELFSLEKYRLMQQSLRPVYALTKGLNNNLIQKSVKTAMEYIPMEMEYLSADIRQRNALCEYNFALENMHFPFDEDSCIIARKRFVFDEFFFFILSMKLTKEESTALTNDFQIWDHSCSDYVLSGLPYALTGAQLRCLEEIRKDLEKPVIMQRLIQGDVGSGKTILAFLAMLDAAANGYQSAMMAPTDVLARQHYQKLQALLEEHELDFPVVLLTGSLTAKEKRLAYEIIEKEENALIIGTHALIQKKVNYQRLSLVITDEQHRFGVKQRESFSKKGQHPHILVMSATPIPRTLAIILYGDLDISVIDEVPAIRKPIKNCVVNTAYRNTAYKFIQSQVAEGHQAYVICPLVEESENSDGQNVIDYTESLRHNLPATIRVEYLHGKMKAEEKNRIMEAYLRNEIQVLVSTTVIEVGVDVPNSTVMMVEDAQRFGLAQLHQLRGRVGRGDAQSYCIFIDSAEKSEKNERLAILNRSNDGFYIAGEDLKLRGPGDFFGIRQSGDFSFKLADVYQDADVLTDAAYEVSLIMQEDPCLKADEHQALRQRLKYYAGEDFALFNI